MPGSEGICVIIPAYENAGTVVSVIKGALAYVPDVFVVDDGSTDGTAALLRDLSRQEPGLRVISHPENRGKGKSLKDGFLAAKAERSAAPAPSAPAPAAPARESDPEDIPF